MKTKSTVLGMAAATAVSGASFSALAGVCPTTPTPISTYLSGGANATCTVLDKTISGMTLTGGFVLDNTLVTPLAVANNPGLILRRLTRYLGPGRAPAQLATP